MKRLLSYYSYFLTIINNKKAHALRLQFEHEKQMWKSTVLQNCGNNFFGDEDSNDFNNNNNIMKYRDSISTLDLTKEFPYDIEEEEPENKSANGESPWGYNKNNNSTLQKRSLSDIPKYGLSKGDNNVFGIIKVQKPFQVPGQKQLKK